MDDMWIKSAKKQLAEYKKDDNVCYRGAVVDESFTKEELIKIIHLITKWILKERKGRDNYRDNKFAEFLLDIAGRY